jgi:enoyl-CoA hydratase/carnithine racemase
MREYETIRVEKQDQVDWVSLNRPEALNAIKVRA